MHFLEISDTSDGPVENPCCPPSEIPRISIKDNDLSYSDFFHRFMLPNRPVILSGLASSWECFRKWAGPNQAHIDMVYLCDKLKGQVVPVADCDRSEYNAHMKLSMLFEEFAEYWQERRGSDGNTVDRLLYLKDWHLRKEMPVYRFYETPRFFGSDWLNEYLVDVEADDYMFVYIGPKGTWTPFHSDVFGSFSWSTNITGTKRWIFLPPGEETKLADRLGNLPFSIDASASLDGVQHFTIVQSPGETIFVPSGWYHQVHNEADTISVNHNWFNACNVAAIWRLLQEMCSKVRREIDDCRDMDDFEGHCQLMLKAAHGIDYAGFFALLANVAKRRLEGLEADGGGVVANGFRFGREHCVFDLRAVLGVVRSFLSENEGGSEEVVDLCESLRCDIESALGGC